MEERQQFALVLQRMKMIAETEFNNELDVYALEIFEKLSRIEKMVLIKRFIRMHFSLDITIHDDKSSNVVDERNAIINDSDKENTELKVFIMKSLFVFALIVFGAALVIGGGTLTDVLKNTYEVVKIMIG